LIQVRAAGARGRVTHATQARVGGSDALGDRRATGPGDVGIQLSWLLIVGYTD
jgi:hypothetical protein